MFVPKLFQSFPVGHPGSFRIVTSPTNASDGQLSKCGHAFTHTRIEVTFLPQFAATRSGSALPTLQ
jgi:hypothetical protein